MVLDGEAAAGRRHGCLPSGQGRVDNCPPVLLIIGRPDDGWLATWSRADAVISHPIDPKALAQALAGLMRQRAAAVREPGLTAPLPTRNLTPRVPMDPRTAWPSLIGALIRGESLTPDETAWAMNEIMDGAATPAQIAGFAVALRVKGETAAEVSGLAEAMLGARVADQRPRPPGRPGRHRW